MLNSIQTTKKNRHHIFYPKKSLPTNSLELSSPQTSNYKNFLTLYVLIPVIMIRRIFTGLYESHEGAFDNLDSKFEMQD